MSEPSLLEADFEALIDRATIAMGRASEKARQLAEETGTEFIARPADKVTYEPVPREPLVVREAPED